MWDVTLGKGGSRHRMVYVGIRLSFSGRRIVYVRGSLDSSGRRIVFNGNGSSLNRSGCRIM